MFYCHHIVYGLVLLPSYSVFSFKAEVINYKGDLNTPPDQVKIFRSERTIFNLYQPGGAEEEDKLCGEEDEDGEGQGWGGRVQR